MRVNQAFERWFCYSESKRLVAQLPDRIRQLARFDRAILKGLMLQLRHPMPSPFAAGLPELHAVGVAATTTAANIDLPATRNNAPVTAPTRTNEDNLLLHHAITSSRLSENLGTLASHSDTKRYSAAPSVNFIAPRATWHE